MYRKKWQPSKARAREFAEKMQDVERFCAENCISQSRNGDSYYFVLNGKNYRVSNHSVEASNASAYDDLTGEKKRNLYHEGGRQENTVYIHASKTRIIEIYNDLKSGFELDGRGYRKAV